MDYLFNGCISLKELNLTNFRFDKSIDISNLFEGCSDELKVIIENRKKKKVKRKILK